MTLRIWLLQIEEIIEISSLVNALSRRVYEPETVSRKLIEILKFIFRNFKLIYYRVWRMHLSVCEISVRGIGFHILTSEGIGMRKLISIINFPSFQGPQQMPIRGYRSPKEICQALRRHSQRKVYGLASVCRRR